MGASGFNLRPLDSATDYPRIAQIRNAEDSHQLTAELLLEMDRNWPDGGIRRGIVAEDETVGVVGYSIVSRRPTFPPGRFELRLIVDRAFRSKGIGAALYEDAGSFLGEQNAMLVDTLVKDNCDKCLRFAERRGYLRNRHLYESVLDLGQADRSSHAGLRDRLLAEGFRIYSFADTDGSEEHQRRLWDLNVQTAQDVPGTDTDIRQSWPFEQFQKDVFQAAWFRAGGQILAEKDGRLIGLCAIGEFEPGKFTNTHTGVLPEFRGRGIALALKLESIDWVRSCGGTSLRTNNDSANAPMIAINTKLGYRPEPGWYLLKRQLAGPLV